MHHSKRLAATTLVAGAALLAGVPTAAQAAGQKLFLNTYEKGSGSIVGPKKTKKKLVAGKPYIATVRGTWAHFSIPAFPPNEICGRFEPRPIYPSKNRSNGPVAGDAEFGFGGFRGDKVCRNGGTTVPQFGFQLSVGRGFTDPAPLGNPTAPHPKHRYSYALLGKGKTARFRLIDIPLNDNYGRFKIVVRAAGTWQCTGGRHVNFGFATEPECTAAVRLR